MAAVVVLAALIGCTMRAPVSGDDRPNGAEAGDAAGSSARAGGHRNGAAPSGVPADAQVGQVASITDGDTLRVIVDGANEPVRLLEVDAPETNGGCGADRATEFVRRFVPPGSTVWLEADVSDRDRYGRLLRYVWRDDGELLNERLVAAGWAEAAVHDVPLPISDQLFPADAPALRPGAPLRQLLARVRTAADPPAAPETRAAEISWDVLSAGAPASAAWATPLGELPVADRTGLDEHLAVDDAPHAPEHSLEVQLPFLQRAPRHPVPVLPIAVGICPVDSTVDVIDAAMTAAGPGAVLLCSTDFSHYHDQGTAQRLDRRTAEAVLALRPERIGVRDACGVFALRGAVGWARRYDLSPELLDLRTSADTYGHPDRVVGYPAFAFARL